LTNVTNTDIMVDWAYWAECRLPPLKKGEKLDTMVAYRHIAIV